jgi:hypothetical protein
MARLALEIAVLMLGTSWLFMIEDTSKCDKQLYTQTTDIVVALWCVYITGFLLTTVALLTVLCCVLN